MAGPQSKTLSKERTKDLQQAAASANSNLDSALREVRKLDATCAFTKCKTRTSDFSIGCKYCQLQFCTTHGLPEIHGCGEAVRRDAKREFLHPHAKLGKEKHEQAHTKLTMKMREMQQSRKKQTGSSTKK